MKKLGLGNTMGLALAIILTCNWILAVSPAAAQGPGAPLLEKPQPTSELPGPGEK